MREPMISLGDRRQLGQHPGLLLQRYLRENATGKGNNPGEKRTILQAAIEAATNKEVLELYTAAFKRWSATLPSDPAPVVLQTVGRLIVGLGSENVLEAGLRLHHTYGMPILPGSALKGLAAHYCKQVWSSADERFREPTKLENLAYRKYLERKGPEPGENFHRLLFGTTDDGGCIIFHDAWLELDSPEPLKDAWLEPDSLKPPLKLDVMTPHHPEWLKGSVAPTDFDSPVPVPFLSVSGKFLVAVSWHGPPSDEARGWTRLVLWLLCDALKNWGIGGKTTSGYGRLADPPPPPPPPYYRGKAGDVVDAVLRQERTRNGGWKAQVKGYSQVGPIQNSDQVPADAKAGDTIRLTIAYINDRDVSFKLPPQRQ